MRSLLRLEKKVNLLREIFLLLWLIALSAVVRAQTPDPRPILRLDLLAPAPSVLVDQAYIYFEAGATGGFDSQFDASKLSNPSGLNVSSFTSVGPLQQLVINGLPPYTAGVPLEVNLFVGVPAFGRYRFKLGSVVNFGDARLVLRDNLLAVRTPLVLNTTYDFDMTFANTNGRYNDPARFVLEIIPDADLLVSTYMQPPLGRYRNVTIANNGYLLLDKDLEVTGTLDLQTGGTLATASASTNGTIQHYLLTGNRFTMAAGGGLVIGEAAGITSAGPAGSIQTTVRSYAADADYGYSGVGTATVPCVAGDGLPGRVRSLSIGVYTQGAGGLTLGSMRLQQPEIVTGTLNLYSNLNTDGNSLTLKSTQTGATAIVGDFSGTLTGTLTQERAIDPTLNAGAGYRHFSNPFNNGPAFGLAAGPTFAPVTAGVAAYNTSATPNLVTPFPNLFGYDFTAIPGSPATTYSAFDRGWRALAPGGAAPGRGRGFIAHITPDNVVRFSGTLNEVAQTVALPANPGINPGWVLLGNPFTAPLDGTALTRPASVPAAFYVFETTGPYAGRYRANVNGMGSSPLIPTGQGFFMSQNAGAGAATLTVPLTARRALTGSTVPTLHRNAPDTRPHLSLALTAPATAADGLIIYAEAGATAAFDAAFDAYKLPSPGQAELAALTPAGEALSISGLALPTAAVATLVPLQLSLPRAGTFTLTANLSNLNDLAVYLLDAQTGLRHDLRAQATYTFAAQAAGSLPNRFSVQLGGPARPTAAATALALVVDIYPNPAHGTATVVLPAAAGTGETTATLRDALGREVAVIKATTARFTLDLSKLKPGIYSLQLVVGEQIMVRQLMVE